MILKGYKINGCGILKREEVYISRTISLLRLLFSFETQKCPSDIQRLSQISFSRRPIIRRYKLKIKGYLYFTNPNKKTSLAARFIFWKNFKSNKNYRK